MSRPIIRGPRPVMRTGPVVKKPTDSGTKPQESKPVAPKEEPKPVESKAVEPKVEPRQEVKPVEPKVEPKQEIKPVEPKVEPRQEFKAVESKPESRTVEFKAVEPKPETRPVESKPIEPRREAKQESSKPPVSKTPPGRQAQPKPVKPKKEGSSTDALKVILVISNFIFMGIAGYLVYDKFEQEKVFVDERTATTATFKADMDNKLAEINRLQDSLKIVIAEKESLGLALTEERAKLEELEVLKGQIQSKQYSINSLNKKLASIKQNYLMAASSMEALNASNVVVLKEKENLHQLLKEKDDSLKLAITKVEELSEKVAIASAMKVQGVKVIAINTAGRELKSSDTYKAMIVGKLKISVSLMKNEIAEGQKEVYLRLIEPGGATLYEGNKSFLVDGKKTSYTDKQTVNVGSQSSVGFLHMKGSRYRPGKYTIEIYTDGRIIGKDYLTLSQ